jgi:3-oxoacyl-[acyl-carrier protein] reductase
MAALLDRVCLKCRETRIYNAQRVFNVECADSWMRQTLSFPDHPIHGKESFTMELGIGSKRAIAICASSGLGLAACEALAAEGVNLVMFARSREALEREAKVLADRYKISAEPVAGDLTRREDIVALANHLRSTGGVDILVLNTPRPPSPMRNFLDETEDERWSEAYRNQLHGALNVLREIPPILVERGWGRVVAITSASVKQPMPRHAISSIFRAGVQTALKHLANEIAANGVTVNSVAPATVITPTFATYHDLEARIEAVPVKRAGKPEELGATVAFLASENAGFITGQIIQLDGGMTASLV